MKMKLYYVVKKAQGCYDTHDFDYVAGPFAGNDAYEFKNKQEQSWKFEVVEQEIEVN